MGYATGCLQRGRRYFNQCVAVTAVTVLTASAGAAQATAKSQAGVPGLQDLKADPGLMIEFGELLKKLQHDVQLPPARGQSRLLPLQQESTVVYTAFPNYGDAFHQALTIFQRELQDRPVLRAWWQHGELAANGPKVEDALEKVYQLSQFLGDEITVSVAGSTMSVASEQGPSLMILAEIRKSGLKDFLQQMANQSADKSKPPFHVFDVKELAAAKEMFPPQQPVILVRPDLVVGTLDLSELRRLNAHLDANSREFVFSPFGQRVAQEYEGGTTVLGAIDLQKILHEVPRGNDQNHMILQRSGFGDVKYLVWDHKTVAGHAASQMELSFTGPRHGVAAWLGAPGPMGSLDFVSPKVVMASAVLLNNPSRIYDDIREISTASNPNGFASVAQMEAALRLSIKEDLLGRLGGEIGFEVDSLSQTAAVWKAILQVKDPEHDPDRLQGTLSKLFAAAHVIATQSERDGITYNTLRIPSAQKALEISYAFVDGYLVIGSSRETVAEAVRLHRSGESLAKSKKFLASLPPEHGSEASALFYENPAAMAALSMSRVLPQMAESFSQATAEPTAAVICAYGEENAIREATLNRGVDVGGVLVVAAIAIPNLLRARIAANEASAVATIRTANTAQVSYSMTYPQRGFAHDLATLGPDPSGFKKSSADHASFIDATLGNASCTAGAWCTKSGFQFRITAVCKQQRCEEFVVVGTPVGSGTGSRSFCSTSDAVVRFKAGPPLTSPVSVSECLGWPPLQ
jgi:hypothetical protein